MKSKTVWWAIGGLLVIMGAAGYFVYAQPSEHMRTGVPGEGDLSVSDDLPQASSTQSLSEGAQGDWSYYPEGIQLRSFSRAPRVFASLIAHIVKYADQISPAPKLSEIELISFEAATWSNSCLVPVTNEPQCEKGTYPGYRVMLKIDGEVQEWRISTDGKLIEGSVGG